MSESVTTTSSIPAPLPSGAPDTSAIAKQVKKLREAFGDMTLEKFKGRLDEERSAGMKAALKALGVPKEQRDEVLSKSGEYVVAPKPKEGGKSYDEIAKAAAEVEGLRAKVEKHQTYFKQVADTEYAKLPEVVQKELARRGVKEHEAILDEINAMRASGLLDALSSAKVATEEKKPAPTTAAPPGPSTKSPAPGDEKSYLQRYEDLRKTNRMAAAQFRRTFGQQIERALQAK